MAVKQVPQDDATFTSQQLRPLLQALQAAKAGDFTIRLPRSRNGVLGEICQAYNDAITLNENMAKEIVRVGRIVGREGRMTERASMKQASGAWAESVDSINGLIEDLARPTTEVARVITAVADGDLAQKMALEIEGTPVKGEFLRIGTTVNTMVDQLSSFAAEVTRVAREVGTEGKLGGQAEVRDVSGTWKDLTDNVNFMATNLTTQVRGIAKVVTAVANGDLKQKLVVEAKGEVAALADTINSMTDTLGIFAEQVTTVAREVGTEGKLGGQADVPGVAGTWKDLTDNVNYMASNLTAQVRNIALVTTAVANGDLSQTITVDVKGEILELKNTINVMVDQLGSFADEVTRVAREVGTEGKLGGQADVKGVSGTWKDLTDNVNYMASNLTDQVRNIALVTTAVANGDLSQKITVDARGEILELKDTINVMVGQLNSFAAEVTRVAREVGTEGKLGGQAEVRDVSGTWKDLTDNVNFMATNLTTQVRGIAKVVTAVANGDLGQKLVVEAKGEVAALADTINSMTETLGIFAEQVTTVAREVGTEGKLGGQADVPGVAGTWKDLTDNVNYMASNLTAQVRNIALVTTAVANGDLSQTITVDVKGEILELKNTINVMVDQLGSFADEVTRVAREVGTEGNLGGQADVKGVSGTWKDLTDNVNYMASNLTDQVRNIALVTTAVANGDLSRKITVDARGEILELKNTINVMVDQLGSFADEVTRVAREVGTEGKLGGQADVKGVSGTWKDLTDNVNYMASNLTDQVRNIALVTTAVANGDLSRKITVDARGEIMELKNTINVMVDQLSSFADEVTRVAREVGTEGKLGGQAEVKGVSGTWKDLTDNVNFMASNLTNQVRNIALVTTAVANGDLSQKITVDVKGEILELKNTINVMVDQLSSFADEVTRVAREVGTEGKLGGQAVVRGVSGTWKDLTDNVNFMASNLTTQVRGIVRVVTAVANGDLRQKLVLEAKGEIAALADTINSMTDTLDIFAEQVTTVAREVGTEGILGGQAKVPNVAGTWKDLTDNVNFMASNLTTQVRGIAKVVTAVANGDLRQKLVVEVKGEVAALADTINSMTETLGIFAEQVTTVAREVGTEGILGGQAKVPNVAGTWKDLTENVNFMANSLTTQVRAISDVATAVTEGDLTRSITVEAQAEVLALKNNINRMISKLKDTTLQNTQQDWLKTNLARFSGMMQGQKSLESVSRLIMSELTPLVSAHCGAFYIVDTLESNGVLKLINSYAYRERKNLANEFRLGEGLIGQCALEKESILLTNVPPNYIQISSGLGEAPPLNIIVLPVLFEGEIMAVIELASFESFSSIHRTFLDQLTESIGVVLNMISANMRTEELLEQSQNLTQELQSQSQELQSQQEQLRSSNSELEDQAKELEEKASLLAEQNNFVEQKNREVELARVALEEKAEQLALSSKYKSEFLANMSHELRTPLNSMLILAKLIADNPDLNLTPKQTEFANTIYTSGGDLLNLINEILDLSKVEAGKMEIEITRFQMTDVQEYVERTFNHVAQQKGLNFSVHVGENSSREITTDAERLQQVLRNLLSNAFKFTERGNVDLNIQRASRDLVIDNIIVPADQLVAFEVRDTGIGISKNKHNLIFEAFQQADGTTSRKYGGTGLGLSISREITRLLGGRITVESEPGKGSVFTLYLPLEYKAPANMPDPVDGGPSDYNESVEAGNQTSLFHLADPSVSISGSQSRSSRQQQLTEMGDDRSNIEPGDHVMLVIEDDPDFAGILIDTARQQGFKVLVSVDGTLGLEMARQYRPSAITLDLKLAGLDGWTILDQLKRNLDTRHIPVQVISVMDRNQASTVGAIAYLEKPVSRDALAGAFAHVHDFTNTDIRNLLIIEDDDVQRETIMELIGDTDITALGVPTAEEALKSMEQNHFDCVVLDLSLPGMSGLDLLKRVKQQAQYQDLPIIIYTSKDITKQEELQLKKYAVSVIVKGAASSERLLDETSLFLHQDVLKMPPSKRKIVELRHSNRLDAENTEEFGNNIGISNNNDGTIEVARQTQAGRRGGRRTKSDKNLLGAAGASPGGALQLESRSTLRGVKVLMVDDDVRNIFALTSLLENYGADVVFAENGADGIDLLRNTPDVNVVLMDIMMPDMDGYQTMQAIRKIADFASLPIIAVTAKAMETDRQKCLEAGATDYIAKPVEAEILIHMLRDYSKKNAE